MKKIAFISLFIVTLCQASAHDESWHNAVEQYGDLQKVKYLLLAGKNITKIPSNESLPATISLDLANNKLEEIPENMSAPKTRVLSLRKNLFTIIYPEKLLKSFPSLRHLVLSENDITPEDITAIHNAAKETHPELKIIADNIRPSGYAGGIKPAK